MKSSSNTSQKKESVERKQKNDFVPEVGKWYRIEYKAKTRGFTGAAKCVEIDPPFAYKGHYAFTSPLDEGDCFSRWMHFSAKDIKYECEPLPSYKDLLEFWNRKNGKEEKTKKPRT